MGGEGGGGGDGGGLSRLELKGGSRYTRSTHSESMPGRISMLSAVQMVRLAKFMLRFYPLGHVGGFLMFRVF